MATADLTVRGAGVFGLTIALEAARRGALVRVIDPRGPGGGASGGVVGALAPHTPDRWNEIKAFQFDCLVGARTFWPDVEERSGLATGFRRSGRLQPLADDAAVVRARERAADAAVNWKEAAVWELVRDPPPGAPRSPTGLWVHDTLSAQIDPQLAMAALAAAVRAAGGEIVAEGPEAGPVVHATGWEGLRNLSLSLGREVGGGVKGQAAVFEAAPGEIPQLYIDGLHIVTHAPGRIAVGSTSERDFDKPTGIDAQLDEVIGRARAAVPWLSDAPVVARWAGVRPRSTGRGPLVAPWPGRPGHVIANGGFKIGFALAPGIAPMAVELALEGRAKIPSGFALP